MAYEVNKNTIIGDILDQDFDAAPFFLEMGMHVQVVRHQEAKLLQRRARYTVQTLTSWLKNLMNILQVNKNSGGLLMSAVVCYGELK